MSDNPDLRGTRPGRAGFHSPEGGASTENIIRIDRSTTTSNTASGKMRQGQPAIVSFDRRELDQILRIYGFKVADGEWKDYSIDMLKDRAVFSVYRRAHDMPLHCIEKVPKLAAKQGAYVVTGADGRILKRGHELATVLKVLEKKRPKLSVV
ncbi:DUF2794 domain-containing protein [Salaquimonas pukyongi]|uniref:DUF2794 domain-containing protein n=1 Tax=Salaquimonas pukyongi TaxID=2712698 RepID=UPI00096BD066|nr:DUF2794 domain-containing protein [Salaquimonas pukyongi]